VEFEFARDVVAGLVGKGCESLIRRK